MDSSALRSVTLAEVRRRAVERLAGVYPLPEAQAIVRWLLGHFWPEWERVWLVSRGQAMFPQHLLSAWQAALEATFQGQPLAYTLGSVPFLGYPITIRPGVFIPRPETEEWISWVIQSLRARPPISLLEVGCGSGALLVALGKAFSQAALFGFDCNPLAVALTRQNCQAHGLFARIEEHDFRQSLLPPSWQSLRWELIVSNPPYIPYTERAMVAPAVLTYEPHEALFCEGMEFYERLGWLARDYLQPDGLMVVELYPPTAQKVAEYYRQLSFFVRLYQDLSGRWRWAALSLSQKGCIFASTSGSSSAR